MLGLRRLGPAAVLAALLTGCTAVAAPQPSPRPATSTPAPATSTSAPGNPPITVGALGDSLSRGFDACDRYGDCPRVSWATGTDPRVDSVASRLSALRSAPVTAVNLARSGAQSDDLARQVDALVPRRPDLVTLLVGANDVCRADVAAMTPAATYAANVGGAIDRLSADLPDAVLLVASVPDVTALLPAAASNETARFLWSRLGGCSTVLEQPRSTSPAAEQRRAEVRARIAEYNAALRSACAQEPRCVYDDGALHAYRPDLDQLSALDYFHPSIAGLTELAALQWAALRRSGLIPAES